MRQRVLHTLYDLDDRFQVPGYANWMENHITYEKGSTSRQPHWRCIRDDKGRIIVAICHNMDLGDGWENSERSSADVKLKAMEVFWVMMDVQLPRPISRIVFRCSEQTKTALLSEMQIHEGSVLSDELLQQAREAAKAYNERLTILVRQSIRQEEFLKSAPEMRKTFISPAIDESVNVIIYDPAIPPQRIRVDGSEHNSQLIEETIPHGGEDVPAAAVVKLAIVIGKDGKVLEIDPLAGPDPLISPAVDAVRRWKYRPTLLNGRPVEIETTVEVPFPPEK